MKLILLLAFASLALTSAALAAPVKEFTFSFEEKLGHAWSSDLLKRTIEATEPAGLFPDRVALTLDGKPAAVQLDRVETFPDGSIKHAEVWFSADLPAGAKRTATLRSVDKPQPVPENEGAPTATPKGNILELTNAWTIVRLPLGKWSTPADAKTVGEVSAALTKHLGLPANADAGCAMAKDSMPGPLLGVKLPSGKWIADARLKAAEKIDIDPPGLIQKVGPETPAGRLTGFESSITAQGPLFVRVHIDYTFEGGGTYAVDVTLRRDESMVRIDERFEKAGALILPMGSGFRPTAALYECNKPVPDGRSLPITYDKPASIGNLVGWNFYFQKIAPALLLSGDAGGDIVGLVSTDADWLPYPYNQALNLCSEPAPFDGVVARASLASGHRHWAIYVGKTADFPAGPKQGKDFYRWWTHRTMLTLDKVSQWQVEWPGMDQIAFPHTFFDAKDLPAIRKSLQAEPTVQALLKREGPFQLSDKRMTDIAARYLITGDAVLLPQIKAAGEGLAYLDHFMKMHLDESGPLSDDQVGGMAVSDEMLKRCIGIEFLLGSDQLTPAEKHAILVKLAFMVHVIHDPFWMPPNHPFLPQTHAPYPAYVQGTPNQKHCYISARGMLESALTGHPDLPRWTAHTLEEYERCLPGSVAESGVHAESPFYSSRDTMRFGPFWRALTRAGVKGPVVDQWLTRLAKTFEYMGDMTTPPEPRMGGVRVYHPLGRSSPGVIDPTFIIGADPWAKDNPALASRMRWLWEQQGKPSPYIMDTTGGRNISLTLLAAVSMFDAKPLEKPPLTSKRWDGMGAILRSRVGSGDESNVVFRHDPFGWDLYETNNGGVYFYGKGAPLLPRFGAYWTQPNLMSIPFGNRIQFASGETTEEWTNAIGNTTDYASLGIVADSVAGITEVKDWRRSVLFAKDLDRDDPVYVLVRDQVMRPNSATALHWWVMSKAVQPEGVNKMGVIATKQNEATWLANLGKNWKDAPKLTGQLQHFEGQCGVDLDLFIAQPANPVIVTDAMGVGPNLAYCVNKDLFEYQQLVRIEQPAMKDYLTLLTPRWPASKPREYRTIADGCGVAIQQAGAATADYLFLADKAVTYKDKSVDFTGLQGIARRGPGNQLRLMVAGGKISVDGATLESTSPAAIYCDGKSVRIFSSEPKAAKFTPSPALKSLPVNVETTP